MSTNLARIEHIFNEALKIEDAGERSAYVIEACEADAKLLARVEALLAAHADADNLLPLHDETGAFFFSPISERPGNTIDRYKLLEKIGEGGFGVVFMAEQEQPIRRRVALKIIKAGMDTCQVVARFEAERQALALMDHPNIAKVFDAGATDTGRPYFVMELVRGVPITEYCDDSRLTTEQRLELFKQVCSAVQHAHQKGVIHRDLKPSNVMVTMHDDKAVPKVIDFGVAKATQGRLTERTLFTEFRQMIGTPTYMSPEQAQFSGLDVDTRSDIYSLGVLLYELLTGTTPIKFKQIASATYDDIRRLICEEDAPSPSVLLSSLSNDELTTLANQRRCDPTQLTVSLRNDLDWIVMRCLEKDRTRRYPTANALAEDIENYIKNEPVEARAPTRAYRLTKFIRRNKVGVVAASAVLVALLTGLALATLGFIQARHQANLAHIQAVRSEEVSRFLQDMLSATGPSVAMGRDTILLREILDTAAQRVTEQLNDQPAVKGELCYTIGTTYASIGDYSRALGMLEQAVDAYRLAFGAKSSGVAISLATLGMYQSKLGKVTVGNATSKKGLAIARTLNDQLALAECLIAHAQSFYPGVRTEEAVPYLREAIEIAQQLETDPRMLADLYGLLGEHLDGLESEQLIRLALESSKAHYPPKHPEIVQDLYALAQRLDGNGKYDEATGIVNEAYAIAIRIYPSEHVMVSNLAGIHVAHLAYDEKWAEAEQVCRHYVRHAPADSNAWTLYGQMLVKSGDFDGAIEKFSRAIELTQEQTELAEAYWDLAAALLYSGRVEEYRAICHNFLQNAKGTTDYTIADKAAKASLLLPVDGADFEVACQLADFAGSCSGPQWILPWTQLVKALAVYRRGQFDSGVEAASRSAAGSPECKAAALYVKACCLTRLGQVQAARNVLSEADDVVDQRTRMPSVFWRDWLVVDLLQREAANLLKAAENAPQP